MSLLRVLGDLRGCLTDTTRLRGALRRQVSCQGNVLPGYLTRFCLLCALAPWREPFAMQEILTPRRQGAKRRAAGAQLRPSGARKGTHAKEKKFGRRGSPLGAEAELDCGKKGLVASARGTRSRDAAGQHRRFTNQARFVRSTLPPSPGPPAVGRLPRFGKL